MADRHDTEGMVFNIQHYSIHDGPGIRTTVFLKGCPMRCFWCQNPESQILHPEVFFDSEKCIGCGKCVQACPEGAISLLQGKVRTERLICKGRGNCSDICPSEARNILGRPFSVDEAFEKVKADEIFYQGSGGGLTISGGEPLFQPRFSSLLLKRCREAGIHTVVDTCGYAEWSTVEMVLQYADLVLYDFKHMDPLMHREYTGVLNELILENAKRIYHEMCIPILARMTVIPGYNDSVSNVGATARFIAAEMGDDVELHLLPYHRLGETKYERLEKQDSLILIEPPTEAHLEELKSVVESAGIKTHVGG